VTPDLKPTPEAVQLLAEQYGSVAHLAEAIGVGTREMFRPSATAR